MNSNIFRVIFLLGFFVSLFYYNLMAANQQNENTQNQNAKYIYHTSEKMFYDAKNKVFELSGDVQIFYSDTKIACDVFRYYEEKKYGRAEGNPRLYNPKVYMKSVFVDVFFDQKQAVAINNVFVRVKNDKKEKKDDKKWEYFDLFTNKLIYNWEKQNVFIPEKVKIVSKDMYLSADQLIYNDKTKILVLKGNVYGKSKDQYIKANKLTYNMDKDIMNIEGNVKSVVRVSEEQNDQNNNENVSQKKIVMQMKEIYQEVLEENKKMIDYFVDKDGFVPNLEIYVNYYTTIEIYRNVLDRNFLFSKENLYDSDAVFAPLGYKKKIDEEMYEILKTKYILFYLEKDSNFFFEDYKELINFVLSNSKGYNSILPTSFENLNIALDDDKNKWVDELIYQSQNLDFVKGFYVKFDQSADLLEKLKQKTKNKEIFVLIDDNFWNNFKNLKNVVFEHFKDKDNSLKINLLLNIDAVEKLNYNREEFYKFIFLKSYLYGCSIFVNKQIYDIGIPYLKIKVK